VRGIFRLNTRNRTLEKNGRRIKLTQVEYSIIKLFMDNPGKALSREEILTAVWGKDYMGEVKIVDVNIRRRVYKIEDDPTTTYSPRLGLRYNGLLIYMPCCGARLFLYLIWGFLSVLKLHGMKQKWMLKAGYRNIVVLIGIGAFSVSISSYYYKSIQASLETKAKTATDFFANYITKTYAEYYQSAYKYTELFSERDRLELQFINAAGKIEVSSYGLAAGTSPGTPDIANAVRLKKVSSWMGRTPHRRAHHRRVKSHGLFQRPGGGGHALCFQPQAG
jgi:hypothetical protein